MENLNANNDEELTISMTLEDGTELECDVIAIFPAGGNDYIALLPDRVVEGYEEGEIFLYRYIEHEDDEIELITIDTDEEYELAADAFDELLDEEEFNSFEE